MTMNRQGVVSPLWNEPGTYANPKLSPDGRRVAWLSDASGEYELYVANQDGSGEARQLTKDGDTWRFAPLWSPDSKKLLFGDKKQRLQFVDVDSGGSIDGIISACEGLLEEADDETQIVVGHGPLIGRAELKTSTCRPTAARMLPILPRSVS